MNRVIKAFEKFNESLQEEIYALYHDGELERATFPFKGEIADGVIFSDDENMYLIPISSIKASKFSSAGDDDDDDDIDSDDDSGTDEEIDVDEDNDEMIDEE